MPTIKLKKGLDVPLAGALQGRDIVPGAACGKVALLPTNCPGIKTQMLVKVGDKVRLGQPLFADRRDDTVKFTSPAGGTVEAIHRGERRKVLSVVIAVDSDENPLPIPDVDVASASRDQIREALLQTGFWTALRQRPFDRVAVSTSTPSSLFVTAADSQPLAGAPSAVLAGRERHFIAGLKALSKLVDGKTYLCTRVGDSSDAFKVDAGVEHVEFEGPHPSGNVGVHVHSLDPVGGKKLVWHIGYQDVAAIGELLTEKRWPTERVVAVVGPNVEKPGLVRTRLGAEVQAATSGRLKSGNHRTISGSVLSGATSEGPEGFIGRYDNMVTVMTDEAPREFIGWMLPGGSKYSATNAFTGKFKKQAFDLNTDTNGSLRTIVPIGSYERVMPMDILPTPLIKALASNDIELADLLGVLELVEEDLALCEFVCPSKVPITSLLRAMLDRIEKEG